MTSSSHQHPVVQLSPPHRALALEFPRPRSAGEGCRSWALSRPGAPSWVSFSTREPKNKGVEMVVCAATWPLSGCLFLSLDDDKARRVCHPKKSIAHVGRLSSSFWVFVPGIRTDPTATFIIIIMGNYIGIPVYKRIHPIISSSSSCNHISSYFKYSSS